MAKYKLIVIIGFLVSNACYKRLSDGWDFEVGYFEVRFKQTATNYDKRKLFRFKGFFVHLEFQYSFQPVEKFGASF